MGGGRGEAGSVCRRVGPGGWLSPEKSVIGRRVEESGRPGKSARIWQERRGGGEYFLWLADEAKIRDACDWLP